MLKKGKEKDDVYYYGQVGLVLHSDLREVTANDFSTDIYREMLKTKTPRRPNGNKHQISNREEHHIISTEKDHPLISCQLCKFI